MQPSDDTGADRSKLTKRFADAVRFADHAPAGADRVIVWDADLPGFGLRLMASGAKFYVAKYRNAHNRQCQITIGRHGTVTCEEARDRARGYLSEARAGGDPLAARRAMRIAPTVNDLMDRYVAQHVERENRASTQEQFKRLVEKVIRPKLGTRKLTDVTVEEMRGLHHALSGTPRQANIVMAICSKAFSLAEEWGWRTDNPCRRVKHNKETRRDRYLNDEELARLGATLRLAEGDGLPWNVDLTIPTSKHLAKPDRRRTRYASVTTHAIRLLLFTGCRLSEVLNLKWSDIDTPERGMILLRVTKSGKPQSVLITTPARLVLDDLEWFKGPGPWVLPSTVNPKIALTKSALEQAWQRVRVAAGIPDVRLHDMRHTVGTIAGQSGGNAFTVRDLLRHGDLAVTGRYVSRDDGPLRVLSELVSGRIAAGLASRAEAEVIPIKKGN